MDNKKILRTAAGLALGLALLAPGANEVYATSTNTNQTVEKTKKEKFDEKLEQAKTRLDELKKDQEAIVYKNANLELQTDFVAYINLLSEEITKQDTNKATYDDAKYEAGTYALNVALQNAEARREKLNGKVVDTRELYNLTSTDAAFRATDAYTTATDAQKTAYEEALKKANEIMGKGNTVLNTEYEEAYNKLMEARGAIDTGMEAKLAKEKLENEIKLAADIKKDKDIYTEASYDKYNKALIAANTTVNTANATLEQYQASLNALQSAKTNLAKKATADDEALAQSIADLKKALHKNEVMVEAAEYLLTNTPKTVENVKDKLEKVLADSKAAAASAREFLDEIEKNIQG